MDIDTVTVNHAVKAIIFRNDGKVLMQQRDYTEGLPFQGRWTFFGGSIAKNEKLKDALKRELKEELEFSINKMGKKLFQWTWKSDWSLGHNHFFSVKYSKKQKLNLKEGISMKWFSLEDFVLNPVTPDVYENFEKIFQLLFTKNLVNNNNLRRFEKCLIKYGNFIKKNNRVYYTSKKMCDISRQEIFLLKNLASLRKERIFRICMHIDDDSQYHEMLMIHVEPVVVGPLKLNKNYLSYHMIEGEIIVYLLDKKGKETEKLNLSIHNGNQFLRLEANKFRKIATNSPFAVFLEVTSGPFKDSDTVWFYSNIKVRNQKKLQNYKV